MFFNSRKSEIRGRAILGGPDGGFLSCIFDEQHLSIVI